MYIVDYFDLSPDFNYYAFGVDLSLYSYTRETKNSQKINPRSLFKILSHSMQNVQ